MYLEAICKRVTPAAYIAAALLLLSSAGCGDDTGGTLVTPDASPDATRTIPCGEVDDPDRDSINRSDDGEGDADGDGTPNWQDSDSDGDGISDADEAGDMDCTTPPMDTDGDGTPDFLDLDSNADGVTDAEQGSGDGDGDGIPDFRDPDLDGDGILNAVELGEDGSRVDTDGDGIPDLEDLDSDDDTISDRHEGATDRDEDGLGNFRDLDSDGDSVPDNVEAGDADLETPPAVCANEINPATGAIAGDGYADFADPDSDNDGLGDGRERDRGTDPCDGDSDDDGLGDLVEVAYEEINCPDPTAEDATGCGCASMAGCGIPEDDYFLVLPYGDPPQERDLDFSTAIRVADVFFLTDITGSMSGTLTNVQNTVATPGTGLIAGIADRIPDAWFGGGSHQDFPFGSFGGGTDTAFTLSIGMTPPEMASSVETAFSSLRASGGADGPESQTEALYQIVSGMGGTWTYSGGSYTMPTYSDMCIDTGWGAPCFRDGALPIVVLFTDICAHEGPPGESTSCRAYTGITPAPVTWTDMVSQMNTRGAKFVGINASRSSSGSCASMIGSSGTNPCYFLRRTAEETGSVDLDGNALVYDLPNDSSTGAFVDSVVNAVETVATRVPIDVTTRTRSDATNPDMVDARQFIKARRPACTGEGTDTACWEPPMDVAPELAIAAVDMTTFYGVVPGTRVIFTITFQNDFREHQDEVQIFIAYIDVSAGGASRLDTRQVYIVVPAATGMII